MGRRADRSLEVLASPQHPSTQRTHPSGPTRLAEAALPIHRMPPSQVLPTLGPAALIGLVLGREDTRVQGRVRLGSYCKLARSLGAGHFPQHNCADAAQAKGS